MNGEQLFSIHLGITLGRRQRGVAQKFLYCSQVTAAGQKMRGEGMAEGMRRDAFGQVKGGADQSHGAL